MLSLRLYVCSLAIVSLVAWAMVGCDRDFSTPSGRSRQLMQQRTDRGESLLGAAITQLQDLPSCIETKLRAPSVVLDSTKSSDGEDVYATCGIHPDVPEGMINYIFVPEGNSRFRSLGVKSGDILKYYVLLDEESLEAGFAQEIAMELPIAQVLNDNALLIEGGLSQPVTMPAKIEVWRYEDDRLVEISRQLARYVARRPPPIAWEPSPDEQILGQIVVRLNQWLRQSRPASEWKVDPLLATLSADLRDDKRLQPYVSRQALAGQFFQSHEGRLLQEAVWLRDISRWAHGESFSPIDRATALFDWTVRNVQLDPEDMARSTPHRPWQILLYGHGTAEERAWVFAKLCWQQGLDVVMLETPSVGGDPATAGKTKFWLPALFDDGQLYLFDTRLGLPIPGPGGEGVATLEQVAADDSLLRQLDLDDAPYPMSAEQLGEVEAAIVAEPFSLSRRAADVDAKLSGDDKLALSIDPSMLAESLKTTEGVSTVRLWEGPFETLRDQLITASSSRRRDDRRREAVAFQPFAVRPKLWKARTRHFQGRHESHAADDDQSRSSAIQERINDHREARQLYTDPSVRPPERSLAKTMATDQRQVYETAKRSATYWLGLLSFDDGNLDVAAHWLDEPLLTAADSPWVDGARYNLARTLEAQGKAKEAIELYEEDTSPQRHGNRLRTKWLKESGEEAAGPSAKKPAAEGDSPKDAHDNEAAADTG